MWISNILSLLLKFLLYAWSGIMHTLTWLHSIYCMDIDISFLSDVAAFNSVIIGLWVPLSISIITNLSERYGSEVIIRIFEKQWPNKWLVEIAMLNLISTVCLRFFSAGESINDIERGVAWGCLLLFISSIIILAGSIKLLKRFVSNPDSILDRLFSDAEKIIQK